MLSLTAAVILSASVLVISLGVGAQMFRYQASVTAMLGMMIGMTLGMMTGLTLGYFVGAATDMFVSNLIGVSVGVVFGVAFGRVGGLMGMMDGGMGGMMGGMMGAMLGLMLQYLYDGWAISITSVLISVLYLASMIALVRLVRQGATTQWEIDPVCDMQVDPKTALRYVHEGQAYYFCTPACRRTFVDNVERTMSEAELVPDAQLPHAPPRSSVGT